MTNPNDSAFEQPILGERENGSTYVYAYGGLTKREYFAALAMQGFSVNPNMDEEGFIGRAVVAVKQADALIAELSKTEDAGK